MEYDLGDRQGQITFQLKGLDGMDGRQLGWGSGLERKNRIRNVSGRIEEVDRERIRNIERRGRKLVGSFLAIDGEGRNKRNDRRPTY